MTILEPAWKAQLRKLVSSDGKIKASGGVMFKPGVPLREFVAELRKIEQELKEKEKKR
jgi:hypothetical protein